MTAENSVEIESGIIANPKKVETNSMVPIIDSEGVYVAPVIKVKEQEKPPGIPFSMSGKIDSMIYYSPESNLKTDNYIWLNSRMQTSGENSIRFYIYTHQESPGVGFEQKPGRNFSPYISGIVLNIHGPLHSSLKPVSIELGQGRINYSPYIAKMNNEYLQYVRGIVVSNVRLFNANVNGFLAWEPRTPYRNMGTGIQVQGTNGPWKYDVVSVHCFEGYHSTNSEGEVIELGTYRKLETDHSLQLERRFSNGFKFNILYLEQETNSPQNIATIATAKRIDLEVPVKKQRINISYRNFAPGFAPRYRDKTPAYRSTGTKLPWNPVDKYKNQRGITLKSSTSFMGRPLSMELDSYSIQPENEELRTNLSMKVGGKIACEFLFTFDQHEKPLRYSEVVLRRNLASNDLINFAGIVKLLTDRTGNNNNLRAQGAIQDYGIEASFKRSFLTGLTIGTGIQRTEKNYQYIKGQWDFIGSIQLDFNLRAPDELNWSTDFWEDEYGRLHYRDNYVSLKSIISF